MKKILAIASILTLVGTDPLLAFGCQGPKQAVVEEVKAEGKTTYILKKDDQCEEKLPLCEETLEECNNKVKELDAYGKHLRERLEQTEKHLEDVNKYADVLEEELKKNDPNSFWERNKLLIGFIGGVLLTSGVVIGTAVVVK